MQKNTSNYERVILALTALLALGVSGWLIFLSNSFASTLTPKSFSKKNETTPAPIKQVDDAISSARKQPTQWREPEISGKAVPLNKSVLLVLKDDQIFDLALPEPRLRPPMTNEYLVKYELQYLLPTVADQDPDNDGFNNLEEFNAGKDPKDPRSMPPITDKLFLVERISNDYRIVLRSGNAPYQIATADEPRKKNWFVDPAAVDSTGKEDIRQRSFGGSTGERFQALSFESKKVPDDRLGEADVSELKIKELVTGQEYTLVMRKELNLAVYQARMEFRLRSPAVGINPLKEGESFRIPGYEDTTYRVLKINEDSVNIAPVKPDGSVDESKPIIIKKG